MLGEKDLYSSPWLGIAEAGLAGGRPSGAGAWLVAIFHQLECNSLKASVESSKQLVDKREDTRLAVLGSKAGRHKGRV